MNDIKMVVVLEKPGNQGMDRGHLAVFLERPDKLEDVGILVERCGNQDIHGAQAGAKKYNPGVFIHSGVATFRITLFKK
jgi:hypothetical protein